MSSRKVQSKTKPVLLSAESAVPDKKYKLPVILNRQMHCASLKSTHKQQLQTARIRHMESVMLLPYILSAAIDFHISPGKNNSRREKRKAAYENQI